MTDGVSSSHLIMTSTHSMTCFSVFTFFCFLVQKQFFGLVESACFEHGSSVGSKVSWTERKQFANEIKSVKLRYGDGLGRFGWGPMM